MMCLTVAALSALYTAMLFRMKDTDVATGISFILLLVLGVIGGNLVPIYILPDWLMSIGAVTPNGLALMSMIQWIQGSPFQELWSPILYQGVFFIVILVASLWIFPRRGGSDGAHLIIAMDERKAKSMDDHHVHRSEHIGHADVRREG